MDSSGKTILLLAALVGKGRGELVSNAIPDVSVVNVDDDGGHRSAAPGAPSGSSLFFFVPRRPRPPSSSIPTAFTTPAPRALVLVLLSFTSPPSAPIVVDGRPRSPPDFRCFATARASGTAAILFAAAVNLRGDDEDGERTAAGRVMGPKTRRRV